MQKLQLQHIFFYTFYILYTCVLFHDIILYLFFLSCFCIFIDIYYVRGEGYNHIIGKLYIKLTIKVIFWGIIKLKGKLSELSTFELQNEAF